MTSLASLWLPILVSAVLVFVASSAIHMLPLWHKTDYPRMPSEGQAMDAWRPLGIPPGEYMVPRPASREEMKSAAFQERWSKGPVMIVTILPPGPITMGKSLALWVVYAVVVGIFAAYVTGRALPPGAEYLEVFRFSGTTAFVGYALALWQMAIWYKRSLRVTLTSTLDGLIYALLTAGVFGWLWPGA